MLYEKIFVKPKVTVMQVSRAITGGSKYTAALNVINRVSGLQVFCGESGGMSVWGLVFFVLSNFFLVFFNCTQCKRSLLQNLGLSFCVAEAV